MQIFAQIYKVDAARREVWGRACQEVPDRSGEMFDYKTSKPFFEKWSEEVKKDSGGKSLGNVRSMHGNVAAGKVIALDFNDDELAIDIGTKIVDDNEWQKVLEGVHTGFSLGGKYVKKWPDGTLQRYTANPSEISLVDRPCIPTATFFDVIKADGSVAKTPFKEKTMSKKLTAAELAAKTVSELMEKGIIEPERLVKLAQDEVAAMQKNGLAKGIVVPDIQADAGSAETQGDGGQTAEDSSNVQTAKADIAPAMTAEDIAALVRKSVDEALAAQAATADAAKAAGDGSNAGADTAKVAARDDVNPKEGKDKYGDVEFADAKNKKYPIDTEAHIRAAWNYINQPKNAAKYSAEDLKAIKAKIIAAWKKKIDKDGPPSASEKMSDAEFTKRAEFIKSMWTVSDLARLLQSISYMRDSCKSEADWEGDDSELPGKLQAWLSAGVEILKDMVDEETQEMLASGATIDPMPVVMEMADKGDLGKAGARHSKADYERVQKMHDTAVELGASCTKADGGDGDMDGKHDHGDLAKFDSLAKQLETTAASLEKIAKENTELKDRIAKLEAQPEAIRGKLRVVAKGEDVTTDLEKREEVIKTTPGEHNPDAAFALIKSQVSTRGGIG